MPPKKSSKKDPNEEAIGNQIDNLEGRILSLQSQTAYEQTRADTSKTRENEMKQELFQLDKQFKEEKDSLYTITNDMTRQYKDMQDQLLAQVNELTKNVAEKEEEIKNMDQKIYDMTKDYENRLRKKDDEINDLKKKIEEMSAEFAKMLRDTLDKMQQRIEIVQWDNDIDPQKMKKIKGIAELN